MRKKLGRTLPLLLLSVSLLFTSLFALFPKPASASIRMGDIRNFNFRYKITKTTSDGSTTITIEGYSKASSGSVGQTWVASKPIGNNIPFTPISASNGVDAVSFKIYVSKSDYSKGVVYTIDGEKASGQKVLSLENATAAKTAVENGASSGDPTNTKNTADTGTDTEKADDPEPSCEVAIDNPLSWIICPVITLMQGAVNIFYNAANTALNVKIEGNPKDPNSTYSGFYTAWSNLRNIANVLFVVALLIIIISQLITGKM